MSSIPEHEIEVSFSRSSGPGGQNVNKTSTKVLVVWKIRDSSAFTEEQKQKIIEKYQTEVLQATSQETRSQPENRIRAIKKLNRMVEIALIEEKDRVPTKPTLTSRIQRLFKKRQQSIVKTLRKKPGTEE
jgi:ribosome-associated protein